MSEYKLELIDVNYTEKKLTFLVNGKDLMYMSFEFVEDLYGYISKKFVWVNKL